MSLAPEAQRLADLAIAGDLDGLKVHLTEYPADPAQRERWDANNAFIMAAAHGQKATVEYLLDQVPGHVEVDRALMFAACNGQPAVVAFLLKRGADPLVDDQAALRGALRGNYTAIIALLAPNADRVELAQRLHQDARWSHKQEDWAKLDRLAVHATDLERAQWKTWGTPGQLPWLHGHARAQARQKQLEQHGPTAGSRRPRS